MPLHTALVVAVLVSSVPQVLSAFPLQDNEGDDGADEHRTHEHLGGGPGWLGGGVWHLTSYNVGWALARLLSFISSLGCGAPELRHATN